MKVFIACALGALIGGIVAIDLGNALWWAGMLAGGFVGYLAYDIPRIVTAVPGAWKTATQGWGIGLERWKRSLKVGFYSAIFGTVIGLLGLLFSCLKGVSLHEVFILVVLFTTHGAAIMGFIMVISEATAPEDEHEDRLQIMKKAAFKLNLFGTSWLIMKWTTIGTWKTIKATRHLPNAVAKFFVATWEFIREFLWNLFKIIHSDERLLCGVDAAIGAGAGFFAGNALIGALVGGVLGVLNYEIVSRRILGLAPMTHKRS